MLRRVAVSWLCRRRLGAWRDGEARIVGAFAPKGDHQPNTPVQASDLTSAGRALDEELGGKLLSALATAERLKPSQARLLLGVGKAPIAVVGLGERGGGVSERERRHEGKERTRSAVAAGAKALQALRVPYIAVDGCGSAEAAAEGASLALFAYDGLKRDAKDHAAQPSLMLLQGLQDGAAEASRSAWERGLRLGAGQNFARELMEMPPNLLTPTTFADVVASKMQGLGVRVRARDEAWLRAEKMGALLSVSRGSAEAAVFLELEAGEGDGPPAALVGKGVTFDSGGISLKPSAAMDDMRADMGGAAAVAGTLWTMAALGQASGRPLPRLHCLIPLVENMPSGTATRPGDIVTARNGLSIKVDNTDAEGRMILADALDYARTEVKPSAVVDVATLTGACRVALGAAAAGCFVSHDDLWRKLSAASAESGDRLWRLPLFGHYAARMKSPYADLNNVGKPNSGGGAATAATFLQRFVHKDTPWAHIDIAGSMQSDGEVGYLGPPGSMTGSPTRTLVHWLQSLHN